MGRSNTTAPSSMTGPSSVTTQRQRNTSLRTIAGSNTPSKTPTQARQVPAATFPARSDSLVSAPSMTNQLAPAFESETGANQPDMPTDYSDGANFQVTDHHAQEMPTAKQSKKGRLKAPADHMYETRPVPKGKETQMGILKSKKMNRKLSEGLSNLYVDDEAVCSKDERDTDKIKPRSEKDILECSERTATPESSNPRLVRIFPIHLIPLHPLLALIL